MSEWKRSTRELPWETLPPDLVGALRAHLEQHKLGPILVDAQMCVQTESQKARRGLFGSAETVQMGAVVTLRWLVWVVKEQQQAPVVIAAQLKDLLVEDYAGTPFAKLIPDSGLQVTGDFGGSPERASAFIALEDGPVGRKFKELVVQLVQEAKK